MRRDKNQQKQLALEHIQELFKQAEVTKEQSLANRYVTLARNMATRNRVRMPLEFKRSFCKHCGTYWKPSQTVRIRLLKGKKVYYCLKCKHFTRVPYKT